MERVRSIDDFASDPIGRYNVGATHLVWCHSPTLSGTAHWGRPTEADAAELVRRLELTHHPALAGGFDGFMDARGMESFDWPAFGVVSEYARARLPEWSRTIRRHAIVVPPGIVGALVAGLLPLLGPSYPLRFFSSLAEALDWLGRAELLQVIDELGPVIDEVRGVPPVVHALRDHLEGSLASASIEAAARALGQSARTLQRELRQHRTGFTQELMHARVRAACAMLEHSEEKIEAIARRVGCSSSSRLSSIFCRYLGETPARYRARRRGQPPG